MFDRDDRIDGTCHHVVKGQRVARTPQWVIPFSTFQLYTFASGGFNHTYNATAGWALQRVVLNVSFFRRSNPAAGTVPRPVNLSISLLGTQTGQPTRQLRLYGLAPRRNVVIYNPFGSSNTFWELWESLGDGDFENDFQSVIGGEGLPAVSFNLQVKATAAALDLGNPTDSYTLGVTWRMLFLT